MFIEQTILNSAARNAAAQAANTGEMPVAAAESGATVCMDVGTLPGGCRAPLAFPYVPVQCDSARRYNNRQALQRGTLFQALDLPFKYTGETRALSDSDLHELMAMDFAADDMGLYMTTHSDNKDALALYWSYVRAAQEKRRQYEAANGPLEQTSVTEDSFRWLDDPWPWDEGGNR